MKKQQRPFQLEDNDSASSEISDDIILHDLDAGGFEGLLDEGLDDEEIIDLEDIVDDLDDLVGDDDSGETDSFLDLSSLDGELSPGKGAVEDDDLLKDLGFATEEMAIGDEELLEVRVVDEHDDGGEVTDRAKDIDDGLDIDTLMELTRDVDAHGEHEVDGMQPVEKLPEPLEDDIFDLVAAEAALTEGQPAQEQALAQPEAEQASQGEVSLDDAISRIEARLMEMLQQVVEAKLPGIVREVLREEIEQLKKESQY